MGKTKDLFPGVSEVKASASNAGDQDSIPGLGRSPGEGISYPFQYSWASLLAHAVKNPPAMQETWVQSLGWEDPLKKEMTTHTSILAWGIPRTEDLASLVAQMVKLLPAMRETWVGSLGWST